MGVRTTPRVGGKWAWERPHLQMILIMSVMGKFTGLRKARVMICTRKIADHEGNIANKPAVRFMSRLADYSCTSKDHTRS